MQKIKTATNVRLVATYQLLVMMILKSTLKIITSSARKVKQLAKNFGGEVNVRN